MSVYMHVDVCTMIVQNDNAQGWGHKILKGYLESEKCPPPPPKKNPGSGRHAGFDIDVGPIPSAGCKIPQHNCQ